MLRGAVGVNVGSWEEIPRGPDSDCSSLSRVVGHGGGKVWFLEVSVETRSAGSTPGQTEEGLRTVDRSGVLVRMGSLGGCPQCGCGMWQLLTMNSSRHCQSGAGDPQVEFSCANQHL